MRLQSVLYDFVVVVLCFGLAKLNVARNVANPRASVPLQE